MEGFWSHDGLEVVFHRVVESKQTETQFILDSYRTNVLISHKDASNLCLLGQVTVPCWNSVAMCPLALFSITCGSRKRILLLYTFKHDIHLISELADVLITSEACENTEYYITPGPCILWQRGTRVTFFCCQNRTFHDFILPHLLQCCKYTVDRIWLPIETGYHGSHAVKIVVKLFHSSSCSSAVDVCSDTNCTIFSFTIEHNHARVSTKCLQLTQHGVLDVIPVGYPSVTMVINQLCLSSVDEMSGWLVHREMTALGTDTKQVILCERGRVVDFAVLEDIPKEVTFGKVAESLVLSVTTQSGQGLVFVISTDDKLKMLKKWTDVRLLAFGDFRKNGRHSTLVVFRNVQNDAIFLVDDQITVKKHVFSTCPEQTVSKGLRDTLDATDLLVVRQQLILEDQSKKLVTRRAQLQKALSLLQQLHSSPEAPSVNLWEECSGAELSTTIGTSLSGEWFGKNPSLMLVPHFPAVTQGQCHIFPAQYDYATISRDSHDVINSGSHDAINRGSHDAINRGSHDVISRGSHDAISRGSHDTISRCSHDAISRGSHLDTSGGSWGTTIHEVTGCGISLSCPVKDIVKQWVHLCANTTVAIPGTAVSAVLQWVEDDGMVRSTVVGTVLLKSDVVASSDVNLDDWNGDLVSPLPADSKFLSFFSSHNIVQFKLLSCFRQQLQAIPGCHGNKSTHRLHNNCITHWNPCSNILTVLTRRGAMTPLQTILNGTAFTTSSAVISSSWDFICSKMSSKMITY